MSEIRMIDANALIDYLGCPEDDRDRAVNQIIDAAPTIDPVRHARWVEKEYVIDDEIFEAVVCGECEANRVAGIGLAKYCYDCGCRMDTVALSKTETTTEEEKDG